MTIFGSNPSGLDKYDKVDKQHVDNKKSKDGRISKKGKEGAKIDKKIEGSYSNTKEQTKGFLPGLAKDLVKAMMPEKPCKTITYNNTNEEEKSLSREQERKLWKRARHPNTATFEGGFKPSQEAKAFRPKSHKSDKPPETIVHRGDNDTNTTPAT